MGAQVDVVIVGAGIVGLTTAYALSEARPGIAVTVLDKEQRVAFHQTGRNSGVIHSGLYYAPGSYKARLVAEGRNLLLDFCDANGVFTEICGKVVVAIDQSEVPRLETLAERGTANGVPWTRLTVDELRGIEPHAAGVAALHVPITGIVDYGAVCEELVHVLADRGITVRTGFAVESIADSSSGVTVSGPAGSVQATRLVNCAGLQSDRIATLAGADTKGVRIMPFRGEYYELTPQRRTLCRHLIYPVPDPAFPFLGVHLTRMIDGSVHLGPNAVPALRREGYRWRDVSPRDVLEVLGASGSYKLGRKYWRTGAGEIKRSLSTKAFVTALQRLCPDLRESDIERSGAGVRAQAIDAQGRLLDDFAFADTDRDVHVVNAPSPAATASFAIGREIAGRVLAKHDR